MQYLIAFDWPINVSVKQLCVLCGAKSNSYMGMFIAELKMNLKEKRVISWIQNVLCIKHQIC